MTKTCSVCREQCAIVDGKIEPHLSRTSVLYGSSHNCRGSRKRSLEYTIERKEQINAALTRRLEAVKSDAQIAADAFQLGRVSFKLEPLIKLAIKAHVWRFGPWRSLEYTLVRCATSAGRHKRGAYKMDVYCRFCGGLLRAQISSISNPEAIDKVKHHVTLCALQCLAGQRQMMPNDYKGFIDEDRAFE